MAVGLTLTEAVSTRTSHGCVQIVLKMARGKTKRVHFSPESREKMDPHMAVAVGFELDNPLFATCSDTKKRRNSGTSESL